MSTAVAEAATLEQNLFLNIDEAKSYATEKNLIAAVTKLCGAKARYMVVRNRAGRYTAVFGLGWNDFRNAPAFHGFKVIA